MTDTDPRLEAVAKALQAKGYDKRTAKAHASAGIIVYDALRAFDQAHREEVMPHRPNESSTVRTDNATAPVMGADPPWLSNCITAAHRAWRDSGASEEIINWYAIVRAVLATANAQSAAAAGQRGSRGVQRLLRRDGQSCPSDPGRNQRPAAER